MDSENPNYPQIIMGPKMFLKKDIEILLIKKKTSSK